MISFLNLGRYGRLGNQLFQYAALRSIAEKKKTDLAIPSEQFEWHGQKSLMNQFNIPQEFFKSCSVINTTSSMWVEKDSRTFDKSFFDIVNDGQDILGFFQNIHYFEDYENIISQELSLKTEIQNKVDTYIDNIRNQYVHKINLISIHMRRGDLLTNTNEQNYINQYFQYISIALGKLSNVSNPVFLIFTGGSRAGNNDRQSDIVWCKRNLVLGNNFFVVENNEEIIDFGIISQCDYNIMSHSSTFSWWASFLNKNMNIIAPRDFLLNGFYAEGMYPRRFVLI